MSDLQQAIAWFESRAKNTPMPGARKMFQIALEALLEKAERDGYDGWTLPCPDCGETITVDLDTARCEACGWMAADAELDEILVNKEVEEK